ncbi:glucose-1-phosphate thymidylyltransferase [Euryarchaeota archaeon]|nr:glucose-1-phosphate thymidylyltransferase [Euryarchaeota archaeon]
MSAPGAEELWPSLDKSIGRQPCFPSGPVWSVLPTLKGQMADMLADVGEKGRNGVSIDSSNGPVHIHESATIEPSVHIIGPAYIGPGAIIRHGAYIREFSWICGEALVGHASETKHSILLPGAKAPHFNYVGDSVLGPDVNLGAGVKLSNLRNDGGEVHTRINGERVATGLRKFGAILGEGCQLGCNAVTNPGVVLGLGCMVMPNTTVTGVHSSDSTIG